MKKLIFLYIISLTSCINVSKYLGAEYKTISLRIDGTVSQIEFNDKREGVSADSTFRLPVFSHSNQYVENKPILDSVDKKNLSNLIYNNFISSNEKSYRLRIDLLEGQKRFYSKGLTETEQVKVKMKISIFSSNGLFSSEANETYTITSADAKNKRLDDLYRGALQAVAYKALKDIRKSL